MIRVSLSALALCFLSCTRQEPPSKTSATGAPLATAPTPVSIGSAEPAAGSAPDARRRKPQSAEECKQACNGEFSAHGIMGVVSCLCRTTDSGKDCRDKGECQGECLLNPVRTEVTSPGPPAKGYFLGKCSEFVTTFGCTRRIQAGAKDQGPTDLGEPPPEICQD